MEEEQTFKEFIINVKKKHQRNRNESTKPSIKQSNSDTNFIMNKEKELREEVEEDIRTRAKQRYKSMTHDHKHSTHCKFCKGFRKILKKDRSELSSYIENNLSFLRLLGNQRYNQNSPFLFVEDHKNKIPERQMGLVPIPVKKNRTKTVRNKKKLYNLQRGIVMVRRYQYGRKNFFPALTNSSENVNLIQKWWKKMAKIILIQRFYRGYFIRKQVNAINNLYKFMNNFEEIVIRLRKEKFIHNLIYTTTIPKKRKPKKGNYITKQRNIINYLLVENILFIQKYLRQFKAKLIHKKLLREQKFFVANKNREFITKKNYNIKGIYDKIIMIQFNVKKYLLYRNFFSYKNFQNKKIGTFFIEKNYIDEYSMKVINFYKIISHGVRLLAMKKIRSSYKYLNEYNQDDINKVIFIQRFYLKRYYNKYRKKLKRNKKIKKIGIIDKIKLKDNTKQIKLIQNIYRKHYLNNIKFKKKLIRNKPIFTSPTKKEREKQYNKKIIKKRINNNINNYKNNYNNKLKEKYNIKNKNNKEILEENNFHSNGRLINNICFYSKEYKINQMDEVLFLQTKIYSYLFLKNMRKNRKYINKKDFNTKYLITKNNTNENECIEKIKFVQKIFKRQYKIMKNNIIENFNSKSSTESNESNNKNKRKGKSIKKRNVIPKSPLKGFTYQIPNINTYSKDNNKYYTKYKKDDDNKKGNYNLSLPKNNKHKKLKKTLKERLDKNKTPKKDIKGNYISKKRVEKYSEENYLTFNKKIIHQINNKQCYIIKYRFYNNEKKIRMIQKFWKKMIIYNSIFKKPLNNEIDNIQLKEEKKNQNILLNKQKQIYYNNKTPTKKRNKLPLVKQNIYNNTISNNYFNSNKKNISINQYDNDEFSDQNNNMKSINNLSNNFIDNKNNINDNISKSGYIIKERKINLLKYILLLQNNIRKYIKSLKYIKKENIDKSFICKYRLDNITYNKFLKFIEEMNTVIKIEKSDKNYYLSNSDDNDENKLVNSTDIFFITKIRYSNFIFNIEKIQRNWRLKLESKIIYKKSKQRKNIITKKRIRNNEKEILMIQNIIRNRIFDKNKTISRKTIISNSLYNKKRYSKSNIKISENKGNKNKINKKLRQNMENYMNKNRINNINKLNKKGDYNTESSNNDSNSVKSLNKKEFSNAKINYITKIYKYIIYKKKSNKVGNFVSKEYRIEYRKKKDLSFLKLLYLFINKNIQEYIYYLLKYNTEKIFLFPSSMNTLKRVIKYLRSSDDNSNKSISKEKENNNSTGEKIKKLFLKIFPSLYSAKSPSILISSLDSESKNLLIKTNIYNNIEPDLINYINDFSKYDKQLSNSAFIETRLKNTKLINTNIFTITKFIDDEYANLIYGKYCYKCFLDKNKCICEINKDMNNKEYYYSDLDDILNIEFDPYYMNRHQNEYDSIKWKDITIKRKPKTEEIYEDPITHLIIRTKEQLNDGKKIINSKVNSINNTNDSYYGNNTNSSYNGRIINKIKNDIDDNSINNSKNIAKIKAIYHQSSSKKKENIILIKNNDY